MAVVDGAIAETDLPRDGRLPAPGDQDQNRLDGVFGENVALIAGS